jgi:hypothetical protein
VTSEELLTELTKKLADEGKLVEAGWVSLMAMAIPPDAPPIQIREMRMAFMAGAQHLWASVFTVIGDNDEGLTEDAERRLEMIKAELEAFREEVMAAAKRGSW